MALVLVSTDWRCKDRFKEHFDSSYLFCFSSAEGALVKIASSECHLIVLDSKIKGSTPASFISRLSEIHSRAPILFAYQTVDQRLCNTPEHLVITQVSRDELSPSLAFEHLPEHSKEIAHQTICGLVGESKQMQKVRSQLRKYGKQNCSVHLYGETGTGKELAAEYLHRLYRPYRKLVAVNCSLLCTSLGNSMFFGHSKGAFTDGKHDLTGLVSEADGTTLFLDEVESLSLQFQGHLLRLLEDGRYRRLGDTTLYKSNFRLLSASNERLPALIAQRRLRKDFYYRINDVEIVLPPLREHPEDIPLLAAHYLKCQMVEKEIDQDSLDRLITHRWPGNVRELFGVLKRAIIHAQQEERLVIHQRDLLSSAAEEFVAEARTKQV
ncbi:MAG TPA: sigma 54-interacting transcriptional regulator [Sphaerochaeta sp.]|nr:sigma 54-interacting transcriptional regulator [Sphaerochaeta sp.]